MVGQTVGNYVVRKKLGSGGMGSVYLGEHPMLGRKVAIKVLHEARSRAPTSVQRFFTEARAANEIGDIILAHRREAPPDPSALNPRVTPALASVILHALAKPPDERFQSMADFDRALADAETHFLAWSRVQGAVQPTVRADAAIPVEPTVAAPDPTPAPTAAVPFTRRVASRPRGARVFRIDDGRQVELGVSPLVISVDHGAPPIKLRLVLAGRVPQVRRIPIDGSDEVLVTMPARRSPPRPEL